MSVNKDFLLSIIVPVYNEEDNVEELIKRLLEAVKRYRFEIIFIDDGSTDNTSAIIKKHLKDEKRIKLVRFYRNFGHQMALTAGYKEASGDCVITIDADLQDPPSLIPEMIAKWKKGAKIVYAKRHSREGEGIFKKATAQIFYTLINFLSDTSIPDQVGDFRLLDREVVDFLNSLSEQSRFLRGLVTWGGFRAEYVYFRRSRRFAGRTHYNLSRMMNFAIEGVTSFSTKPLRVAVYAGFMAATLGFLGIIYALSLRFFFPHEFWVTGWTALFVGIMFLGGVQLITIGIIGEYIGKIYQEVQHRPQYLVKEKINF